MFPYSNLTGWKQVHILVLQVLQLSVNSEMLLTQAVNLPRA